MRHDHPTEPPPLKRGKHSSETVSQSDTWHQARVGLMACEHHAGCTSGRTSAKSQASGPLHRSPVDIRVIDVNGLSPRAPRLKTVGNGEVVVAQVPRSAASWHCGHLCEACRSVHGRRRSKFVRTSGKRLCRSCVALSQCVTWPRLARSRARHPLADHGSPVAGSARWSYSSRQAVRTRSRSNAQADNLTTSADRMSRGSLVWRDNAASDPPPIPLGRHKARTSRSAPICREWLGNSIRL
jgi:hypothetical protein